ncbi:MAG: amidohydrolase [Christensenellaceae bacterium]|nr:amidohydrolase [Christensenellaceae bacterium]
MVDAHLHFVPGDGYFNGIAAAAGHQNTEEHLLAEYARLGFAGGVVMGNKGMDENGSYPSALRYCASVEEDMLMGGSQLACALLLLEEELRRENCAGIKIYPGYHAHSAADKAYYSFYELAGAYGKPVAIHCGALAGSKGLLKLSHPLTVDEAASAYPDVEFVMCHFGSPFLADAAAVLAKNKNVSADLSGLLEGRVPADIFKTQSGYIGALRTWLAYLGDWDRVMFGSDWPLVNLGEYAEFIAAVTPEKHHGAIFRDNALRIYFT